MSRVEAAAGMDRLPWLPDEPQSMPATRRSAVAPPAVAAHIASSMVMFMSRTASAMQNGIDVV